MDPYLKSEIDRLLVEMRPDRYQPDTESAGWLDTLAAQVAALIPQRHAQQQLALQVVKAREVTHLRQSNRTLREVYRSGQLPLGWLDLLPSPLAVGDWRVAMRALTSDDLVNFAVEERKRAAREFSARNDAVEGAELLRKWMSAAGCNCLADLNA